METGNRSIARYDPVSNQVDWMRDSGQNGTHMLVVTRDLNKVFTSNIDSNSVGHADSRARRAGI